MSICIPSLFCGQGCFQPHVSHGELRPALGAEFGLLTVSKWHLVRFRASLSKGCQADPGKQQAGLPVSYGQQQLDTQGQSFITKTRSKGGAKRKGN